MAEAAYGAPLQVASVKVYSNNRVELAGLSDASIRTFSLLSISLWSNLAAN